MISPFQFLMDRIAPSNPDCLSRRFAVNVLGKLGDARTVEPLIVALRNDDGDVRENAAKALGRLGDLRAMEPLIVALRDNDSDVRENAAEALGQLGDVRAVEPLIVAIRDNSWNNWMMRRNAAEALRQLGDVRAAEYLMVALMNADSDLRENAAEALGWLGDARAVEPLIEALGDDDWDVRRNAAEALGQLGDVRAVRPLIAVLRDASEDVRRNAAEALGQLGDARAVNPLIEALGDDHWGVRSNAAAALGELGDVRALEPLIVALRDVNQNVRLSVALALGKLGDARAVNPLIVALRDVDNIVRFGFELSLGMLGDACALQPLLVALGNADKVVRGNVAAALGRLGDARAVGPLIGALGDDNNHVRREAAEALGRLRDARAVEPLIGVLGDGDNDVRENAAEALGQLGDVRAVAPLIMALRDADSDMRENAAYALGQLGYARAVEPLIVALRDSDSDVRGNAAYALGQLGDARAVEPLIVALRDSDSDVRGNAADALGQLGDARAVEPLIVVLRSENNGFIREYIEYAVEEGWNENSVELLIAVLEAENSLGNYGCGTTISALLSLVIFEILGQIVWNSHNSKLLPATWDEIQYILNRAVGSEIILETGNRFEQLEQLIHVLAARSTQRKELEAASGFYAEILEYCRSRINTLPVGDKSMDLPGLSQFCFNLGEYAVKVFVGIEYTDGIKQILQQLLALASSLGNNNTAWQTFSRLDQLLVNSGQDQIAFETYRQVVALINQTWYMQPVKESNLRNFFADKALIFDGLAMGYLRLGDPAKAWETLEAAKTRYLGDLIARRQKPPIQSLEQVEEDFWAAVQRARSIAQGKTPGTSDGTQELIGFEAPSPTTLSRAAVAVPQLRQALEDYLKEQKLESTIQEVVNRLWRLAVRLLGHPLAASVRDAFGPVHQAIETLLKEPGDGADRASLETIQKWSDETITNLNKLRRYDSEEQGLELRWFSEYWSSLSSLFRNFYEQGEKSERNILELKALLEVLNLITGRGKVYVATRSRTPDDRDEPAPTFRLHSDGEGETAHQRFDHAQADLTQAWERLSRTRWKYVVRLARGEIVSFADMRLNLINQPKTALVEFHVTEAGTLIYLSRGSSEKKRKHSISRPDRNALITLIQPKFTLQHLQDLMQKGWVTPYRANYIAWKESIEHILNQVYTELLSLVDEQLQTWGVRRLIMVPHRALHLLPLHACWHEVDGKRRYMLDDYEISYAPSSTLAEICRERAAARESKNTLTAISNPTGNLPFSAVEVDKIKTLFPAPGVRILQANEANLEAITASTPGAFVHFACHGGYDWKDPLESLLLLTDRQGLTLGNLFGEELPLPETKLAVLSACETNITDPDDLADEYLGLASGFLFSGASSIVSTLWSVNDLCTAMLMERFYKNHLRGDPDEDPSTAIPLSPGEALRRAQIWVRDQVTKQDVEEFYTEALEKYKNRGELPPKKISEYWRSFQQDSRETPKEHSFDHPSYWAAFMLTSQI